MDVKHPHGAGGSWWVDSTFTGRIIGSYNYRSLSYFRTGNGLLRNGKMPGNLVLHVDTPDTDIGIQLTHLDGYNRMFADGSGSYFPDPKQVLKNAILVSHRFDGHGNPTKDEQAFEYLVTPP